MPDDPPHVLVLGGGFGGLATANKIRERFAASEVKITLVDKKDWFMVGFAKLWIIRGERTFEESTGSLRGLEKKDINFVKEEIIDINLEGMQVKTNQQTILYDFLVVAMGAALAPEKVPGLVEYGMILYDHNHLAKIRDAILGIKSGKLAICITGMPYKCPPAPFEAALLIDSMLREAGTRGAVQIDIYSPAPLTLPAAGPDVSSNVLKMLDSEGIQFHPSCRVSSVEKETLIFENSSASFDLLLAIPPHTAPTVIAESGLASQDGYIKVSRDCTTKFENVYAVGDVTSMPAGSGAVPKAGIFAEGEAEAVAKSIITKITSGGGPELFHGKGGCFLESGRKTAALVEVDAFSEDKPITKLSDSTEQHLSEKADFERDRLAKWL